MTKLLEWSADEASGDALDLTGNGRALSFTSNNISRVTGKNGTGLQQTTTGVTLGPSVTPLATSIRSITFWLNHKASTTGWAMEFYRSTAMASPNDTGIWGLLDLSGTLRFRVKNSSNTAFDVNLPNNFNAWHHVGARFDGTRIWVYYDGVLVNTGGTVVTGGLWTSCDTFRVFDQAGSNMAIDDVRLYDNDILAAGITADMNTPAGAAATNDGTLNGSFSSVTADMSGAGSASGNISGSFSSVTADLTGAGSASGQIAGSFAAPVVDLAGDAALPVDGSLSGQFSTPTVDLLGSASATGAMSGSFSAPVFAADGGVPLPDRDILFTVAVGTRSAYSLEVGASRTSISIGEPRTQIGVGNMDKQWRNGSEQFIDFSVTLKDPEGQLTLPEVEAFPFQVAVTTSVATPARTDAAWVDPSIPKEVAAVDGAFVVSMMHLYEAVQTGLHAVWVKFGPTPESPIYQVTTFVVL